MSLALFTNDSGQSFLIEENEIEMQVPFCSNLIKIDGFPHLSETELAELEELAQDTIIHSVDDLHDFLTDNGIHNTELTHLDFFEPESDTYVYDVGNIQFYNLSNVDTIQTYTWLDVSNFKTESFETYTKLAIDDNYIVLDVEIGVGRHARVYKILKIDGDKVNDQYLLEVWSQKQGEHQTGVCLSKKELIEYTNENEGNEEELLRELELIENE